MASTAAAAKAPAEVAHEAQPKKSKLLLIIVLVVVLLTVAGAGAWFFLARGDAEIDDEAEAQNKPPVFLTIEQFTVNLQPEDGQQFLQVAMTLKVADTGIADAVKLRMPEVRSRVLLLLASKKPSQLLTHDGKMKLTEEIAQEVESTLPQQKGKAKRQTKADDEDEKPSKKSKKAKKAKPTEEEEEELAAPHRVRAVYFTHFIVQ